MKIILSVIKLINVCIENNITRWHSEQWCNGEIILFYEVSVHVMEEQDIPLYQTLKCFLKNYHAIWICLRLKNYLEQTIILGMAVSNIF